MIVPPTSECLLCGYDLVYDRETAIKPLKVMLFDMTGPFLASKIVLKCRRHNGKDIRYRCDTYGNGEMGWQFYPGRIKLQSIESTSMTYLSVSLAKLYSALLLHIPGLPFQEILSNVQSFLF